MSGRGFACLKVVDGKGDDNLCLGIKNLSSFLTRGFWNKGEKLRLADARESFLGVRP